MLVVPSPTIEGSQIMSAFRFSSAGPTSRLMSECMSVM